MIISSNSESYMNIVYEHQKYKLITQENVSLQQEVV